MAATFAAMRSAASATASAATPEKRDEYAPDETDQALVEVSISTITSTSDGETPSRSATIWAVTVRWPWPWGVDEMRTEMPPCGPTVRMQPSTLPDFGSVFARSSGVWASVM